MTRVAILWHMHQPFYEDLVTREHILPWARLHGLKDYYGMVALLSEFPGVRLTFNLVPSLLVQIEAFAEERARDRYLELSLKPAAALTEEDVAFVLANFFHAQRHRMIEPYPRYLELLERRGDSAPPSFDHRAVARHFSTDDLRDLQVWQKLAWLDPSYLASDPRVTALVRKGRGFSEDDKAELRAIELEILRRIIPAYRDAAGRGQIEIATSPFYHPILPLLCDTDVYLRTHPASPMPRRRFRHPEDAAEQLTRAVDCHQRLFGRAPIGLWPSEGSVSNDVVALAARAGFRWMATDEQILGLTLGAPFHRDGRGIVEAADRLYRPYTVAAEGATIACAFRDHALSDAIGFTYAGWDSDAAAADFVRRLEEAAARYRERTAGQGDAAGEPCIFVILDGENAWEHFEGGGRPFLRALYGRLAAHQDLRTVTMAEACAGPAASLDGIFPGSWIDANFSIWIGHHDDRQAWSQLAEARDAIGALGAQGPKAAQAHEELLIAEGSDWCWWYGDDHSSENDAEFDDLYRRHLRNAYRLVGLPIPDELFVSNISARTAPAVETAPVAFITPTIDGDATSYFEWLDAGAVGVRTAGGAMHQIDGGPLVAGIRFGFDAQHLYVRVDAARPMVDLLAEGYEVSLKFLAPDRLRYSVRQTEGRLTGLFWERGEAAVPTAGPAPGPMLWTERGPRHALAGAGRVLELAVPFADLDDAAPGTRLSFFVAIYDPASIERERHPAAGPIELAVPDAGFAARQWNA